MAVPDLGAWLKVLSSHMCTYTVASIITITIPTIYWLFVKHIINRSFTVTCQLWWWTEACGWAVSAACSHHPTARVGHSRGFYCHFDFIHGTKTMSTLHARTWTNQYRMTDEHSNIGTIFNSRDYYSINVGLYGDSRGGGDGQEDNRVTPEVHQRRGDV